MFGTSSYRKCLNVCFSRRRLGAVDGRLEIHVLIITISMCVSFSPSFSVSVFIPLSLSVSVCVSLSSPLFLYSLLSLYLRFCLSVCLSLFLSVSASLSLSVCLCFCLCLCLCLCLSVSVSLCALSLFSPSPFLCVCYVCLFSICALFVCLFVSVSLSLRPDVTLCAWLLNYPSPPRPPSSPVPHFYTNPHRGRYFVTAPKTAVPGTPYRLTVQVFDPPSHVHFSAYIERNNGYVNHQQTYVTVTPVASSTVLAGKGRRKRGVYDCV